MDAAVRPGLDGLERVATDDPRLALRLGVGDGSHAKIELGGASTSFGT